MCWTLLYFVSKVNGLNVETFCHDEAVVVLKNAGDDVVLTVQYFEPASNFLSLKSKLVYSLLKIYLVMCDNSLTLAIGNNYVTVILYFVTTL